MISVGTRIKVNQKCDYTNFIGSSGVVINNGTFVDKMSRMYCKDYCNQVAINEGSYNGHRYWFTDEELDVMSGLGGNQQYE